MKLSKKDLEEAIKDGNRQIEQFEKTASILKLSVKKFEEELKKL